MDTVNDIKQALSAKSRTATLDELKDQGRRKVRLIRAEHIAQMVSEAVHAAIEASDLIDPSEHERLVEKSREEFRSILREREREAEHARTVSLELEQQKARCVEMAAELTSLRAELEEARAAAAERSAPAADPASSELLMSLFKEMATMKATMEVQQAQPAQASAPPDMSAMLDKLTSSLNDRLEAFGKKMGISAAVESDVPTDFSGLFKSDGNEDLESNMENVELKQKTGGGIAANLARLKKLKGGG